MNNPKKIALALALASMTVLSVVLAGCGSGDADVDPKAVESRNAQRAAASNGTPPASATAGATK